MNRTRRDRRSLRPLVITVVLSLATALVLVPVSAAAQAPPTFGWNTTSGSVAGHSFAPNASVDVVVRDAPDGAIVFETTMGTDATGYFWGYGPVDLVPGMEVTVTDGTARKVLVLTALTIEHVDFAADTVRGIAPPEADVWVQVGWPHHATWSDLTVTADGSGAWSADFTGDFNIDIYTEIYATVFDEDRDGTTVWRPMTPTLHGWLNNDQVKGEGFVPNAAVEVVVKDAPDGEVVFQTTAETDASGGFQVGGEAQVDLLPGMEITASDRIWTKVLLLVGLTIEHVDLAADTVSGTAPEGAEVGVGAVDISNGWGSGEVGLSVIADDTGVWTADFAGVFDIDSATYVSTVVADEDGDESSIERHPPAIRANLTDDSVSGGRGFAADAPVEVTIKDGPGGDVVFATTAETDAAGSFVLWLADEVDLVPSMEITASDGNYTRVLLIASLAIEHVDLAADTVSGTAPPGVGYLEVEVPGITVVVTSDSAGAWTADFSGIFDIDATTSVTASVFEADWDETFVRYVLVYDFSGFFQPVNNPPTMNSMKAGAAVPVKFSLGGDQGLDIFVTGYPKSLSIECSSTELVDGIEETVTAGSSGLSYDPTTDQYTYVWKTAKTWASTCRQLVLRLADGTYQRANFEFK